MENIGIWQPSSVPCHLAPGIGTRRLTSLMYVNVPILRLDLVLITPLEVALINGNFHCRRKLYIM